MASKLIEIDTQKLCLLCYTPCCDKDPVVHKRSSSITGFKQLLRYLNVNIKELFNCSTQFLEWMEINHEINIEITLCAKCSSMTDQFNKLYMQYEVILFQFDKCVASVHHAMKSGDDSPELAQIFKTKMRQTPDIVNASLAANLRSQTLKKCSLKLQKFHPQVAVEKLKRDSLNGDFNNPSSCNETINNSTPLNVQMDDTNQSSLNNCQAPDLISSPAADKPPKRTVTKFISDSESDSDSDSSGDSDSDNEPERKDDEDNESDMSDLSNSADLPNPLNASKRASNNKTVSCSICDKKIFKRELHVHRGSVHSEHVVSKYLPSNLSLAACKKATDTVLTHVVANSVIGNNEYKCFYCNIKLNRKDKVKLHLITSHAAKIAEEVGQKMDQSKNKSTPLRSNRSKSLSPVSKPPLKKRRVSCTYCSYSSSLSVNVRYHQLTVHTLDIALPLLAPGTCRVQCGQGIDKIMKKLMKAETQCPKCGSVFSTTTGLRRHILVAHFDDIVTELKINLGQNSANGELDEKKENTNQNKQVVLAEHNFEAENNMEITIQNVKIEPRLSNKRYFNSLDIDILD